jgi:hypothetical protein
VKLGAWPVTLGESIDAADDDVRPEPADIAAKRGDRTISCDEQRKNVEAIDAVVCFEPCVGAGSLLHQRQSIRSIPGMIVDSRPAVSIKRASQSE